MSFDAHEEKIRKIFSGDAQFIIPRNQRKYVWEEKQWKELLGDIEYIMNRKRDSNKDISHFLGSFVLQEKETSYEIIDGQQRITTLFIILSAICIRLNELENKEEHGKTRQYLSGNIGLQSQFMRLKNKSIVNVSFIMSQACEYRQNLDKNNLLYKNLLNKESDGNKRVVQCLYFYYNYFSEECRTLEDLVAIREVILDMKVIHIASEDELDCYDIFEILNARGVDLEDSELLKNFIFKYAQPQYSIDRAKEIWTKIEKNMGQCNGNMEQFLSHFVTYRFYKPTKDEGVFRIIKANTSKNEVNILLDDLLNASERYIIFYHPERADNAVIEKSLRFFALVNHRQFRPLFMALMDAHERGYFTEKQLNSICTYLKNFSFAYTLVMKNSSNNIDTKIHELSREIYLQHSEQILNKIKIELNKFYPEYTEFEAAFFNIGFSNKNKKYSNSNNRKRMRYIHGEIEEYEQSTNELTCNFKECNLEHIMNDSDNNAFTSRVGNILLLSEHINNSMGNASFDEKKIKLKKSNLLTVKKFLDRYGDLEEWNEEKIEKRTKAIAKLAYNKVWKIN
ncbi:DUF262 domain-containing protein [bacterium 1XD21-13]|nr:DUF262 domain-containing protein [bacterium 1XD21-13]